MKALEKHCGEVIPLGPLHSNRIIFGKITNRLSRLGIGKRFDYIHSPYLTSDLARALEKKLERNPCDLLFFPAGSQLLADLATSLPTVYLSDTTFSLMLEYYPGFSDLLGLSKRQGMETERKAINKATALIYASKWAADSAIEDYCGDRNKVHVIPFGANIDCAPSFDEVASIRSKGSDTLKLLFVGVDWGRKGGEIAFQAMRELNERGTNTELTICGCLPPPHKTHDQIRIVGFLDKNRPAQLEKLKECYLNATLFFVPTRNEAAGIVFCEAGAYGLPVISTDTGGVATYVENGVNGYLLPIDADSTQYASLIQEIWDDKNRYVSLCKKALTKYAQVYNWDVWGKKVAGIINQIMRNSGAVTYAGN
jgi:glycosyltransferase involved in cell wall biosynthesis